MDIFELRPPLLTRRDFVKIAGAAAVLLAVIFWGRGLVDLFRGGDKAQGLLSTGFLIGIGGLVVAAILYGFFNL
jgi:hypothetical protein